MKPFQFIQNGTINRSSPPDYVCGPCGRAGVRLFRLPHGATCHETGHSLWCWRCGLKRRGGVWPKNGDSEDTVADLLPAIPTEDNQTFYGAGSPSPDMAFWWRLLPLVTPDMLSP